MRALHTKLALVFAGLLSVVAFALLWRGLASAERYGAEVRQAMNRDVAAHVVKQVRPFSGETIDHDALKALFMDVMVINPALEVYLLDAHGRVLAYDAPPEKVVRDSVDLGPVREFLTATPGRLVEGDDPRDAHARKPFTVAPLEVDGELRGYLYVIVGGEDYDSIAALLKQSHVLRWTAWSGVGLLAFGMLAGALAFGWLTRPLRILRGAMASFREDRPVVLGIRGDDEIGTLARTFERMSRRIADQVQRLEGVDRERREFVASISHDLRTPLASLRGYLELLQDGRSKEEPERRKEFLDNAMRGAEHLERLVNQLFELARLEAGDLEIATEDFSIAELVQDVLQEHRLAAGSCGVRLRCRMPRALPMVHGDIGLIERAIGNLLENATEHTPRGGEVQVRLRPVRDRVEVSVSDTGCGIPADALPRVFERTYRIPRSRGETGSASREGAGLGLAITKRILELHDAAVTVKSVVDEGTTFRFALPSKA